MLAALAWVSWVKAGHGDRAAGYTHILLEVSQTSPVSPPSCPHPGPGLDLRIHAASELRAWAPGLGARPGPGPVQPSPEVAR